MYYIVVVGMFLCEELWEHNIQYTVENEFINRNIKPISIAMPSPRDSLYIRNISCTVFTRTLVELNPPQIFLIVY